MTRRIIVMPPNDKRDGGLARKGEWFDPKASLSQLQAIAAEHPMPRSDEQARSVVMQFIGDLPEPQRTIFLRHQEGETFRDIARSMDLPPKLVLKSLAKAYANLRFVLLPADDTTSRMTRL